MTLSRRQFLYGAGGAVVVLGSASGCAVLPPSGGSGDLAGAVLPSDLNLPEPFQRPLHVPRVAELLRSGPDGPHYEFTQQVGRAEILPGITTEIWGYNGQFPGPTIEAQSGHPVVVRQRNELPTPVVTHLHGGVTPPESDGYPTDLVLPVGEPSPPAKQGWSFATGVKEYQYPLNQRAMTLWYHDHRMDFTGPQVWRGLAGFFLVRDAEEEALPLPAGDKDVPLMICDRSFDAQGAFRYPSRDPSLQGPHGVTDDYAQGVLGDVIVVNGVAWPFLEVSNTRYRFRILNASNARRYELALDPEPQQGRAFVQVGSDGGLLGRPVTHRSIPIAQAERFDVVVDFSAYPIGTEVTLTNRLGDGTTARIMQFRITRGEKDHSTVPDRLCDMHEYDELEATDAAVTRDFNFDQGGKRNGHMTWTINGRLFNPTRMDARPRLDTTEVWNLNADPAHPIHLHLVRFKILSRNGDKPLAKDVGWKDVVDLTEGERAQVVAQFAGYRGRYVFHCHNLEHEDMGMMANFQII